MTIPNAASVQSVPDDVLKELQRLDGQYMQVEVYPQAGIVALRLRRKLSITTEITVLPFSLVDALFKSRLEVLIGLENGQGGTVVPATGPTPAPDSGHLQ